MYTCPTCRLGRVKETLIPFVYLLDGVPLLVPQMPAYVCDVCGDQEYDSDMMMNVQYLIHQHTNQKQQQRELKKQAPADKPRLVPGV